MPRITHAAGSNPSTMSSHHWPLHFRPSAEETERGAARTQDVLACASGQLTIARTAALRDAAGSTITV